MKKELFVELVEFIKEGAKILSGEKSTSRIFENLYDVKNQYFPNVSIQDLESKDKEWNSTKKNPFLNTIIYCPHCNQDSGYTEEGLMFYVIQHDLKCYNCGKIFIEKNNGIIC